MGSRFVALEHGERNIHWIKLAGHAALVLAAVPTLGVLAWYRMTGRWSGEVLIVAGFIAALVVIRSLLRAFSIPECELVPAEAEAPPNDGSLPRAEEVASRNEDSAVLPC